MMQVIKLIIYSSIILWSIQSFAAEQECSNPIYMQQIVHCTQLTVDATNIELSRLVTHRIENFKKNDFLLKKNHLPIATATFIKSQKLWAAYRDNACKADYLYLGDGELRKVDYLECLVNFNKTRIKDLSKKEAD